MIQQAISKRCTRLKYSNNRILRSRITRTISIEFGCPCCGPMNINCGLSKSIGYRSYRRTWPHPRAIRTGSRDRNACSSCNLECHCCTDHGCIATENTPITQNSYHRTPYTYQNRLCSSDTYLVSKPDKWGAPGCVPGIATVPCPVVGKCSIDGPNVVRTSSRNEIRCLRSLVSR